MADLAFWKQQPRPPAEDPRAWSLAVPAAFSALGFFAFAVLAYSFTEMAELGTAFRITLVIVGAISLAIGGEIGTLTTTVEVYRKYGNGQVVWWDWVGLLVSLAATVSEFLIAFAMLLGVRATWSEPLQLYGPIVLGILSAVDSYVNFMEFGLYLADYDRRMVDWIEAQERYGKREYDALLRGRLREISADVARDVPQEPGVEHKRTATIDDWRAICARNDGGFARIDANGVQAMLDDAGLRAPSRRTVQSWARMAREDAQGG